ncbi:Protein of unknown function [Gryllus bimaculatus]|nr:Protein of unknown function [Gryllus bimaculatus]
MVQYNCDHKSVRNGFVCAKSEAARNLNSFNTLRLVHSADHLTARASDFFPVGALGSAFPVAFCPKELILGLLCTSVLTAVAGTTSLMLLCIVHY